MPWAIAVLVFCLLTPVYPVYGGTEDQEEDYQNLPDIEANIFPVKIVRKSSSGKIYLFDDTENRQPQPGRILLLKEDNNPVMAFRVLRTYPDDRRIAAKRVRKYKDRNSLEDGSAYSALEKISDINPPLSNEEKSELSELENADAALKRKLGITPYDPELDASTAPHDDQDSNDDEDEEDSHLTVSVEESKEIDHHSNWLTFGLGYVRSIGPGGGSYLFSSGNLRYGYSVIKLPFFDRPRLQDSFTLEGGFYLFKSIGYAVQGDAYTVLSLVGTLRYNLLFSESFGIFFYGGIVKGVVVAASQADTGSVTNLSTLLPAVGGGILFQVGPSWYTRVDVGLDSITLDLVLRF